MGHAVQEGVSRLPLSLCGISAGSRATHFSARREEKQCVELEKDTDALCPVFWIRMCQDEAGGAGDGTVCLHISYASLVMCQMLHQTFTEPASEPFHTNSNCECEKASADCEHSGHCFRPSCKKQHQLKRRDH